MEMMLMPISLMSEKITAGAKMLYMIILYLAQSPTQCYCCRPTNIWLSKQLGCSENSVTKYIKELRDNHFILTQTYRYKDDEEGTFTSMRMITLTKRSTSDMLEMEKAYQLFHVEDWDRYKDSCIDLWEGPDLNAKSIVEEVVDHLNEKIGSRYKANTKTTQKFITDRLNEGYELEDFFKVIDNKCAEWLYTEMAPYLRPETLFGTKFDTYLNQIVVAPAVTEKHRIQQLQSSAQNPHQTAAPRKEEVKSKVNGWDENEPGTTILFKTKKCTALHSFEHSESMQLGWNTDDPTFDPNKEVDPVFGTMMRRAERIWSYARARDFEMIEGISLRWVHYHLEEYKDWCKKVPLEEDDSSLSNFRHGVRIAADSKDAYGYTDTLAIEVG